MTYPLVHAAYIRLSPGGVYSCTMTYLVHAICILSSPEESVCNCTMMYPLVHAIYIWLCPECVQSCTMVHPVVHNNNMSSHL